MKLLIFTLSFLFTSNLLAKTCYNENLQKTECVKIVRWLKGHPSEKLDKNGKRIVKYILPKEKNK
tara:strand:+ start:23755 stop:23949 length:195 start_codon:yes stop_codon:yes gene_type:complete